MSGQVEILGIAKPEPPRRRYLGVMLAVLIAVVLGVAAAWPLISSDDQDATPSAAGASASAQAGESLGIEGLRTYTGLASDHVSGDVTYPQSPPVGGPHDPAWLACGAYADPVRNENAVHDLEHGAVWITYQPTLKESDVTALEEVLPENGIMSPYPGLESPVVLTVWGFQLALDSVDDKRLEQFLDRFGHGEAAPELGVSCAGGLSDGSGGTGDTEEPGTSV